MVLIVLAGRLVIGRVYTDYEARSFLAAMTESTLYLNAALATASATILALMLTILGLTRHAHDAFERAFFRRIRTIAVLSTISLCGAIILLVGTSLPVEQSDGVPTAWWKGVYWAYTAATAAEVGLFIGIVLMLLGAIFGIIRVMQPGDDTGSIPIVTELTGHRRNSGSPPTAEQPTTTDHGRAKAGG